MTKKTVSQELDEIVASAPVETADDKAYDRSRQEKRDSEWMRETALSYARDMHKNNGGMLHAQQIIDNAQAFLTFLKGENK